jgi:hypothetical protein
MVKGNLLLESETFHLTHEELPTFAERMEAFILAVDKCREHGDSIYGKGDLSYTKFLEVPLYEYCDPDTYAILQERIPGFRRDMHVFLTYDLMNYDNKMCNTCTTLDEIENTFPNANNGLIGPECNRFNCNPDLTVFSEESWNCWKVAYLTKHPEHIDWKNTHPYLPNLEYSNQRLSSECFRLFGCESHTDFYKHTGLMAGGDKNALAMEVGKIVAESNFYQYNDALNKLNQTDEHLRKIYMIEKLGRPLYLSIDVEKAAFEVCDHNGSHLGEYLFDGTKHQNADNKGKRKHDIKVR